MKIWKIITVLLAVLLLAGCVGGATISSITVSLDAPATGEKVKSATTSTSGVKVTSTTWSPVATDTFDASQTYTATIVLEPSSSSDNFASSVTVKLNGNSKTYTSSDNGKKVTVQHTFSKTVAATTISEIKCNLEKPLAANTPAKTVSFTKPTSGLKSTVTWDTTDKKFVLGKKYKATVVIESTNEKAYPITSDAVVYLNSGKITDLKREGNSKISFTYQFGETEPKGIADSLSFTVTAPTVGKNPSNSVSVTSHNDKVTATLSWNTKAAFEPDTPYTATITVNAKEGYIIKNDANAKVNGFDAIVSWESNTKAVVTYTFAQIESVDLVNVNFGAPKTGDIAQTKASTITTTPSGAAKDGDVKWAPALTEGAFDAGVEYTATVSIPISGANMVFDKDTYVYINGEKAQTTVSSDYKTITAVYTFPKTFFFPNPLDIIKEFYNLMLAFFNPASYAF
ncbi:MAG: hypothetical protein IKV78_05935 [Methanocorpusculum sp.]|nr:hypothetical protein [Methanocorpusculum sp.]